MRIVSKINILSLTVATVLTFAPYAVAQDAVLAEPPVSSEQTPSEEILENPVDPTQAPMAAEEGQPVDQQPILDENGNVIMQPQETPLTPEQQAEEDKKTYLNLPSILFTFNEQMAIQDARNTDMDFTGPDCEVVECAPEDMPPPPPPEKRYIRLGGIAFNSPDSWTIWLNKQRITPDALPEEVLDLKVFREYVEMKWYDDYTKQILPIRLRPHQAFHMDQRIFLPG